MTVYTVFNHDRRTGTITNRARARVYSRRRICPKQLAHFQLIAGNCVS